MAGLLDGNREGLDFCSLPALNRVYKSVCHVFSHYCHIFVKSISDQKDKASAIKMVDPGSITSREKPKTTKVGLHSFLLDVYQ